MSAVVPALEEAGWRAIERLLTEFGFLADSHDAPALCELFMPDAVLDANGTLRHGHAELLADFQLRVGNRARKTRHIWSNLRIVDADNALVRSAMTQQTFDQEEGGAVHLRVNDMADTFSRDAGGAWKFQERIIRRQFAVQLSS